MKTNIMTTTLPLPHQIPIPSYYASPEDEQPTAAELQEWDDAAYEWAAQQREYPITPIDDDYDEGRYYEVGGKYEV